MAITHVERLRRRKGAAITFIVHIVETDEATETSVEFSTKTGEMHGVGEKLAAIISNALRLSLTLDDGSDEIEYLNN